MVAVSERTRTTARGSVSGINLYSRVNIPTTMWNDSNKCKHSGLTILKDEIKCTECDQSWKKIR